MVRVPDQSKRTLIFETTFVQPKQKLHHTKEIPAQWPRNGGLDQKRRDKAI